MDKQRLISLIKRRQSGTCSAAEKAELYELMRDPNIEKEILLLWDHLNEERALEISSEESERLYGRILSDPQVNTEDSSNRPAGFSGMRKFSVLQKAVAVAAMFALFLSTYFLVFRANSDQEEFSAQLVENEIEVMPGSKKARVVFGDGSYQELGEKSTVGEINNGEVFAVDDQRGGLSYHGFSDKKTSELHTLITPMGGEYMIRLADGTKVWMNADSKLIYPVSFNGVTVREVELEGEAYFDVAKREVEGKRLPFIVKSKGQTLEVLGTEFNVNTFRDKITTTLIEGSVKVSFDEGTVDQAHILKPNEQSLYSEQKNRVTILPIDPYYVTAWKSGDFAFDNVPLESVMEDIARWYDVEIDYKSDVSEVRFSGKVSKFEHIETLLQTIEWTGSVKLKLHGRRVVVMR